MEDQFPVCLHACSLSCKWYYVHTQKTKIYNNSQTYQACESFCCSTDWISWTSTSWSRSRSSSMRVPHVQGLTPFPSSQCWNMAQQQSLGSPRYFCSIVCTSLPRWSKSMRSPRSRQHGANSEMILILSPSAVFSSNSWAIVGWVSKQSQLICHTL